MSLKKNFFSFLRQELGIALAGVVPLHDFSREDMQRITGFMKAYAKAAQLARDMGPPQHPRQLLGQDMQSLLLVAAPNVLRSGKLSFEQCRPGLLGLTSAHHVCDDLQKRAQWQRSQICSFFRDRGVACKPLAGPVFFPAKIMAARCGLGYYGKNSMILHPGQGSWFSLTGYMVDTVLEPDEPLQGDCGDCDVCVQACPARALHTPYHCDDSRCLNMHLGHNKLGVPPAIRPACRNLLVQGCTVCRDVCPRNKGLSALEDCHVPRDLLHPSLPGILAMDDQEWKRTYGRTMLALTLRDKKYLQRNAAIALGNFGDERAVTALVQQLNRGEPEVRGCAAWALGRIGSGRAMQELKGALKQETDEEVQAEIRTAVEA